MNRIIFVATALFALTACQDESARNETASVERQQKQFLAAQPVPAFDWSLERDLVIQLYTIRNGEVTTHSVWRSDYGMVEGDCPSMGYGIPYDTSLTNPLRSEYFSHGGVGVIEQPEPSGLFPSKTTSATWVFCIGKSGALEPVYVEGKVTVYPGPVTVDYNANRVIRRGDATVSMKPSKP